MAENKWDGRIEKIRIVRILEETQLENRQKVVKNRKT